MSEPVLEPDLPICDPHHHLWDHPGDRYLLGELLADVTSGHNVESTVFVECGSFYRASGPEGMRSIGETEFAVGQAAMAASGRYGDVRACEGIVGRIELSKGGSVEEVLTRHIDVGGGRFKGVRQAGAFDPRLEFFPPHEGPLPDPRVGLYGQSAFRDGFRKLAELGLSFEAAQFHHQLGEVAALADANPTVNIVLNHVGGPVGIGPYAGKRAEVFAIWRPGLIDLAKRSNVYVKLGGLGMTVCGFGFEKRATRPGSAELAEAWRPYIETCIEAFGAERSMFESNFPVDGESCDYVTLWNAFKRLAAGASSDEKSALFNGTAKRFYRLV